MSIHEGHRQRLKDRFCKEGLENFDDLYVLELLLFYCLNRKDTNPVAHGLIDRFGSVKRVLEASREDLMSVDGIGEHTAVFLSLIREVGRYYQIECAEEAGALKTVNECGKYLIPYFYGREYETVFLLCLDAKCKVLCCKQVSEGSVNSTGISIRKIVETALNANATSVIVAHNHPSGLALPSAEDIQTTMRIARALNAVEIVLADHIVVADEEFTSLLQSGYYRREEIRESE